MESWKKVLIMNLYLDEIITDVDSLWRGCVLRNGYIFAPKDKGNIYDAIVIRNPADCGQYYHPRFGVSAHTLDEHIEFVNKYQLKKAIIIAENLEFIKDCPTLQYITIVPAVKHNDFDFSPLYDLQEVIELNCITCYGENEQFLSSIDYSKIKGIKKIGISGKGHLNYNKVETLEKLWITQDKKCLSCDEISQSRKLKDITLMQCMVESLNGIEKFEMLQSISLYHNRKLNDISMLRAVANSLRQLTIENCPKIRDFSALLELTNLEHLHLEGSNTLPNLEFIIGMKNLKTFSFTMNVEDGDLKPCEKIPFVRCKNRKHYNLKDKDLPKNLPK